MMRGFSMNYFDIYHKNRQQQRQLSHIVCAFVVYNHSNLYNKIEKGCSLNKWSNKLTNEPKANTDQ